MPYKDPEKRRAYHKQYMHKRYHDDPEFRAGHLARVAKNNKKNDELSKKIILVWKKRGCCFCDELEPVVLDAHHRDPKRKKFNIGTAVSQHYSVGIVEAELAKCACVCANCHRKLHAGLLKVADATMGR